LADEKDDRRGVGRRIVRKPRLPVLRNQTLFRNGVDVIGERERDYVGGKSVNHGAGLFAGASVALPDAHGLTCLCLPFLSKKLVVFLIQLARRVVGSVQKLLILCKAGPCDK